MSEHKQVIERRAVPRAATWNAESIFTDRAAFEEEIREVEGLIAAMASMRGTIGSGGRAMAAALSAAGELERRVQRLSVYSGMAYNVDATDSEAASMDSRVSALSARAGASISFIEPEILALGKETALEWAAKEPALESYGHYLANLWRNAPHVRSSEVEEVIGLAADPFGAAYGAYSMLTGADMRFDPAKSAGGASFPVYNGNVDALLSSGDREVRRSAWESHADGHLAMRNTLSSTLVSSAKLDLFRARARRYSSCLEAALFGANVPVEVFHNLIEVYREGLPIWRRYWDVRRRALGVETLHPYDIWAPLSPRQPKVGFAQAVEWICAGMAPLGSEYVEAMRRGCGEERWVDYVANKEKRPGAFSSGSKGTHPFIMMHWHDDLHSMSTLAHELGHSMHSYYTWRTQPQIYSSYSTFVAEVASNFNQALVRAHLLSSRPERDLEMAILEEAMSNFHRYLFLMPTLARFELEVHERVERGGSPSASDLISICADLFEEAYGGAMAVDRDRVGITWAQFGHLYASYYTFQYATGIAGAHAIAERVTEEGDPAAERYLRFLSAGSSFYPLDALRAAGCDLEKPDSVRVAYGVLSAMVDRLEALVSDR